jgi:SAM-dependent methyltransferase
MYAAGGYHRYAAGVPEHYVRYSLRRPLAALAWTQEQLGAAAGGRAVDIGCGVGGAMLELARLGWDTTGVEPDPDLSEMARSRFGLDVKTGFFDAGTFPPEDTFDLAYASHVWEHLSDPLTTTRAVRGLLRDGGHFMVVVPTFRRARRMAWGTFSAAHNFMYSEHTLGDLLRASGFEVAAHRFAAGADSELWMLARAAAAPKAAELSRPSITTIQAQLATVPLRAPLGLPTRIRTHARTLRSDPKDFSDRLRRWTTGRLRRVASKLRP